jgi:tetratricopeptide (TPR) repeat protein
MKIFNPRDEGKSRIGTLGVSRARLVGALFPALILVLTVTVFLPALQNNFVVFWDDQATILDNRNYRGLGWAQLGWMFTTFHLGHYQPLSWMALGLDYLLWGMDPFGYHLTSLILHTLNAVVFYFLCVRLLSLSLPVVAEDFALRAGAGFAAVLFAIHPLRVESVAWVTERRDVLSGLFFLLTVLCYIRGATAETKEGYLKWMAATLGWYILSLLSKAVGMTLPAVLLVLDVYPLRRLGGGEGKWFGLAVRKVWLEKLPFVVLALGAAWVAILAQFDTGAVESLSQRGLIARLAQALYSLGFYLQKTFLPVGLSPIYELPAKFNPGEWMYVLSGLAVAAITCTLFVFRRQWPAGLAVWVYYAAMVAPVSGIVQAGPQLVADRYSYLSCLGWAILIGGGLLFLWERRLRRSRMTFAFVSGAVAMVVAGLAFQTWKQTQVWHDSQRLFRYVLACNPGAIAHNNLGNVLMHNGRFDEAIEHFRRSLQINPYYHPYVNLAIALSAKGREDEAVESFRQALRINPRFGADDPIGGMLVQRGLLSEAIRYYGEAFEIETDSAAVHNNLGLAYSTQGEFSKAVEHYRRALELDPKHAVTRFNMGNALSQMGETEGAIEQYRMAIQYDSRFAEAHRRLGVLLEARGQGEEAMGNYRRALEINPQYAAAHFKLGLLLERMGDLEGAIGHLRRVTEIDPSDAAAHLQLGKFLKIAGKARQAEEEFEQASRLQPGSAKPGAPSKEVSGGKARSAAD